MYLLPPKTPLITIIALIAIFCFLVYPVWNFWWIEKRLWRRCTALALLVVFVCGFGYYVWPVTKQIQEPQQPTPRATDTPQGPTSQEKQPKQATARELAKEFAKVHQQQIESQRREQKAIIENNINLSVNYPLNCWAAAVAGQPRYPRLIKGETMTAPFESRDDYCLAVRVCNDNDGIPLDQPLILIQLTPDISIRPLRFWKYNFDNNRRDLFGFGFGSVVKGTCVGPDDMIKLGFPKPGVYPVYYRISGIAQGIAINAEGRFNLELTKEK